MNVPKYVQKLDNPTQLKWKAMYTAASAGNNEGVALYAANSWLKRNSIVQETTRERVHFELEAGKELVKASDDGEQYLSFVLADDLPTTSGNTYNSSILENWASQINDGKVLFGDIDHKLFDKIVESGLSDETVESVLKNKTGIAKSLKAIVEDGKLWIRTIIDKRYKKVLERAKGVSLEAAIERNQMGEIIDADLLSFTFNVNTQPDNPRALIA